MQALKNSIKWLLRQVIPYRLPILLHTTYRRFPVHSPLTVAEAESTLTALHPDTGGSCLCRNNINPVADLHIIIPVYNAARYLTDCLDSVYTQKTRFTLFVSIVDDGSTDDSADILDKYLQSLEGTAMYDRTEVIHQQNRGLSMARNRALDNIRGRYVTFVDSDDMLLPGAIESLMSTAVEQDADIAEGNSDSGSTYGMACGKVYGAELFRTVHFPPGYWFEDTINIFYLYPTCRKRIQVAGKHYYYRNNTASIMHSFQGNPRAIDSMWVSRRVLSDYFASGHRATEQLFLDFVQDTLSTAVHIHTLSNEQAMQALFVILADQAHKHFDEMLGNEPMLMRFPFIIRHTAKALAHKDYRKFRAVQASVCHF